MAGVLNGAAYLLEHLYLEVPYFPCHQLLTSRWYSPKVSLSSHAPELTPL